MARKSIDCRDFPSEERCTVMISADTEHEVLDAAVAHAVKAHGHLDSRDLRDQIRHGIKETASV